MTTTPSRHANLPRHARPANHPGPVPSTRGLRAEAIRVATAPRRFAVIDREWRTCRVVPGGVTTGNRSQHIQPRDRLQQGNPIHEALSWQRRVSGRETPGADSRDENLAPHKRSVKRQFRIAVHQRMRLPVRRANHPTVFRLSWRASRGRAFPGHRPRGPQTRQDPLRVAGRTTFAQGCRFRTSSSQV